MVLQIVLVIILGRLELIHITVCLLKKHWLWVVNKNKNKYYDVIFLEKFRININPVTNIFVYHNAVIIIFYILYIKWMFACYKWTDVNKKRASKEWDVCHY